MPDQEGGDRHIAENDAIIPQYHLNIYQGYLKQLPDKVLDTYNIASDGTNVGTHRQIIARKIKYYRDVLRGKLPF
tara:strand:- start:5330 stop:5554 length:225 start_codon:yes stop_codon:yes gene_type:complete